MHLASYLRADLAANQIEGQLPGLQSRGGRCELLLHLRIELHLRGPLAAVLKLPRRSYEGLRILPELALHSRMSFQKLLKLGMVFQEFLILDHRWILGDLLGDIRMVAKEFMEASEVSPRI